MDAAIPFPGKNFRFLGRLRRRDHFLRRVALICAPVLLVAGCGLPAAGPDVRAIVRESFSKTHPFVIIDVQPAVLDALAFRQRQSLAASFGATPRLPTIRIVQGDVISVSLWEAPPGTLFGMPRLAENTTNTSGSITIPSQSVGNDGTIRVPYAGRVPVVGRTTAEVERAITDALANKAVKPQALVDVQRSERNTVTVTGEVAGGARVIINAGGERVLDVIAAAGGLRAPVQESVVQLTRNQTTARIGFENIIHDPRENVFVTPGDVVTVVREPRTFTVLGAATRNAKVAFDAQHESMAEALALVGGVEDSRADPSGVFLFRWEPYAVAQKLVPAGDPLLNRDGLTPIAYRFNLAQPATLAVLSSFPIEAHDVIYIANATGADVQKFFNIVQGGMNGTLTAAAIAATAHP
jgi:polysaccharide biosynthesis/export protein